MGNPILILVSDDFRLIESTKSFANHHGLTVEVHSPLEWEGKKSDTSSAVEADCHGKVLPFRPGSNPAPQVANKQVCTMDELESVAIKDAIFQFKGNLTEASKALGIGRATLYRKVKQYNIDLSGARRRRASAA